MYLLQLSFLIILMRQVSGNVLDTVSGIRLVGGSGPFEGRVELQIAGIWGTVCDTNFDMNDAEVLCRMLHLKATSYIHGAYHGEGHGPVYVDNLRCRGHESDVSDCQHNSGSTCVHSNDVSLICTECGDIRVGNGNLSISSDGRTLQISCDDESVANLGTSNCTQDGTWSQPAVYCKHKEYPLPFTGHRLEYGAGLYDGRVELLLNGTWGTICGNGFREIEAVVICNMFNLTYDRHYPGDSSAVHYRTGSGPVYIDNLYCTGTENNINQCIYDVVDVCDRYEFPVAVVCKDEQMNITEIRLVDGTSPHEGRVELFWNGVWGTVGDRYVDEEDARFLCALLNLNYTHHYDTPVFGYGDEPILIDNYQCDPSAKFISANDCVITAPYRWISDRSRALSLICTICPEPNITNGKVTSSNGSEIVVTCDAGFVPRQVTLNCDSGVAWVQEEWCTRYEQPNITSIRVSGTNGPYHGVVEVEINGTWASVCYDNLVSFTFAHVICPELGAQSLRTYTSRVPETSDGAVYVKRLTCSSSNDPINNCYFDTDSTCNRNFFIYCWGPPLDISDVRLVNGASERSGRAEIKVGDIWGTICDTYFGIDDANVFCKMLDLKAVQYFPGSKYGAGSGPLLVDRYYCYSSTIDLSHCSYLYLNECDSGSIVSVICNECGETELSHWDVSFFTYSGDKTYADCSYYNTYVGTLELTCDNVTQNWVTNGECQEYTYPINVMDIRLANGTPPSSGRVELKTMGYWGTICGDSFGQNEANMICAMVGYWPAVAYYTNASHGEGSGPIFVDDLRCGQNASDLNNCLYVTYDDCTHSEDVSVICTDCGDPTPSNGFSNTSRTNYSSVTQITCSTGYICEGNSTITCLINGSWSDQPKCRLIDCGDPTPEYGSVNTTETTNGTVVLVSCNTGYQRSGSATIICQINDTWTDNPSCDIKDCGIPSPPNADVELSNNMTTYGAMATITCITGYLPTGSIIASCLPNGSWDVWPTCEVVDCGDPVPYKGFANSTYTVYGSIVEIGCETGLNISGNSTIQCLEDGIWSDTPVCDVSAIDEIRLMSLGGNKYEGVVEVKINGNWLVMSRNYSTFDNPTANVLCKTFGFSTYGYSTTSLQAFDLKKTVTLYEDLLVCNGNEVDATECVFGVLGHRTTSILEAGWTKLHCSLCDDIHYGQNCSHVCDCELNNVDLTISKRSCDVVTGSCACKSDWTGSRCEIVSTPDDTTMLIIIITLSLVIVLLLVVIIIVCVYKYRKRTRKGFDDSSPKVSDETLKTGKRNNYELTATTRTTSVVEYNTISDSMVDVDINVDTEYDIHPDLLERTDDHGDNGSDGYMTPKPTGIGSNPEYANTRIEPFEGGYRSYDNGQRQLPDAPIGDQMKLDHPYEDLKDRRQGENVYSKMAVNK